MANAMSTRNVTKDCKENKSLSKKTLMIIAITVVVVTVIALLFLEQGLSPFYSRNSHKISSYFLKKISGSY